MLKNVKHHFFFSILGKEAIRKACTRLERVQNNYSAIC